MTPLDVATECIANQQVPIPLFFPGETIRTKTGTEIADGKRPAAKWRELGDMDSPPPEVSELLRYWRQHPNRGVGIVLRPSQLLVIDGDSDAAVAEIIANTPEPCNNIVKTRHGIHAYYRRPAHCPALRAIQRGTSGKIDVLADGFVVAPPSVHKSGFVYEWVRRGPLQEAPDWAVGLLMSIRERSFVSAGVDPSSEPPYRLTEKQSLVLRARDKRVYHYLLGQDLPTDRSRAIWLAINTLIRLHYTDQQIASLIWYGALSEKPRQRGIAWLGDEIARARLELTPG